MDLHHQHPVSETGVLLIELQGNENGGAAGIRTPNLYDASVALSCLSYGPR